MIKRILISLLVLLLLIAAAVTVNTLRQGSRQLDVRAVAPVTVDAPAAAGRLAAAIRLRTVSSHADPSENAQEFRKLHAQLEQQFPRIHAALKRELVGEGDGANTLLFTWTGSDPAARPVAFLAHQDVVPIAPGTEAAWGQPPFGGVIADGFVWGRGTWDNKGNLLAQMEAVEMLLAAGFKPRQTIYLVMGHDEEVGGLRGAALVAKLFKSRGVRLDWLLDEGLLITQGLLAGLDQPAALVGVAEKGSATLLLTLNTAPGHSSMPPPHTAIGIMSAALARVENHQLPADINGAAKQMFDVLAPEMRGLNRVLLSNLWLFAPVVRSQLEKSPSSNAMLRTTTALTIVQAGNRDNVLPGTASAAVNFRLLPGETGASVAQHVRRTLGNDAIQIRPQEGNTEPSPVSSISAPGYAFINRTVRELFPGTVVAPGLSIAASDSRHFLDIADNVYRFSPMRARPEDLQRFHGTDERVSIANYVELIQFYHQLLRNAATAPSP